MPAASSVARIYQLSAQKLGTDCVCIKLFRESSSLSCLRFHAPQPSLSVPGVVVVK